MDVPSPLSLATGPVVLREPWARGRIAVGLVFVVVALVVPGTSALLLRPDNPGEGYVALTLAALAAAVLARRFWTAAVRMDGEGIARVGRPPLPWADVTSIHWRTVTTVTGRATDRPVGIHWLEATTASGTVRLTRYPARGEQADRFTARLRGVGVPVTTPDWSGTARPADA